jgi:outer membrane protein assembly factor BamB
VRPPILVIVTALALVLLGACSSSSHKTSPPASSSPSSPTTASPATTAAPAAHPANPANWFTYNGNNQRTGLANQGPAHPDTSTNTWTSPELDGDIYAQPLIVGDVVYVATENDTAYALHVSDGSIIWQRHFGEPVAGDALPCGDVDPVGVTGTPVVDTRAQRMYVVGMVKPAQHMLFALDTRTGKLLDKTVVDAPGLDPRVQNQRSALTLSAGKVFVPFGGRFGDCGPYHGAVVSVATTAKGLGAVNSFTLPTGRAGGFWVPPGMTQMPDGSFLVASGNSFSTTTYDYGSSVVKLSPALKLVDSFAPKDWAQLNETDADIGSTGPVLLPNNRVFQVGKHGIGYLLDANHLGGIGGQLFTGDVCHGSTAFSAVAHDGNTLFVPCSNGVVEVLVSGDSFKIGWTAPLNTPGPTIVTDNAVWTVATVPSKLTALDRTSGNQLTSKFIGASASRFVAPSVVNGVVYVAPGRHVYAFG